MPLVLVVVLLTLIVLLRSLVAPLFLLATVVLSFAGSLGLSLIVFRYGFGQKLFDPELRLIIFIFLVALGVGLQHLPDEPRPRGGGAASARARGCCARSARRAR